MMVTSSQPRHESNAHDETIETNTSHQTDSPLFHAGANDNAHDETIVTNTSHQHDSPFFAADANDKEPAMDGLDDNDNSPSFPHTVKSMTFDYGESKFDEGVALAACKGTRLSLTDLVKHEIFPHLKIIHDDAELNDTSTNSLSCVIMDKLNVHVNETLRSGFWSSVKFLVNKQLSYLRTQVNSKLRAAFFGKYTVCTCLEQHILNGCLRVLMQTFFLPTPANQSKAGVPSLDRILNQGRKDPVAYAYFVNVYLTCSRGRTVKRLLLNSPPSMVYSIGDEALALLYIENSRHIWENMKETGNTKKSSLTPKYTVSGDKGGGGERYSGWNKEGRKRFNALFEKLEKERESEVGKVFDDYYESLRDKTKVCKKRKSKEITPSLSSPPAKVKNTLSTLLSAADNRSTTGSNTGNVGGINHLMMTITQQAGV
jgi:hypothetical protein